MRGKKTEECAQRPEKRAREIEQSEGGEGARTGGPGSRRAGQNGKEYMKNEQNKGKKEKQAEIERSGSLEKGKDEESRSR